MPKLTDEAKNALTDKMREAMRNGFIELFAANGNASMEQLAQHIEVSKGTLYNYYSSKSELISDVMHHRYLAMMRRMTDEIPPDLPADQQLMLHARIMVEDFEQYRYLRMEFLRNNPLPANSPQKSIQIVEKILNKGVQDGLFRQFDTHEVAIFILCTLIGKFRFLLKNSLPINGENELNLYYDIVIRSLCKSEIK